MNNKYFLNDKLSMLFFFKQMETVYMAPFNHINDH